MNERKRRHTWPPNGALERTGTASKDLGAPAAQRALTKIQGCERTQRVPRRTVR